MCDVLPSYNPYDGADDFEGSNNNTEDFDSGFSGQRVNASAAAGGKEGFYTGRIARAIVEVPSHVHVAAAMSRDEPR